MNGSRIVDRFERWLRTASPAARVERRNDGTWVTALDLDPVVMAETMNALQMRLTTITGVAADEETRLIYHYAGAGAAINLQVRTSGGTIRSIAPLSPAANWIEREIHDLYGVTFTGHPDLTRLIRPPQLAGGFFREPARPAIDGGGGQNVSAQDDRR